MPYKSSKEIENELRERGYNLHHRSRHKPSQKQMKMLAMARAREAAAAGEGTPATYKGQEGRIIGCWFVYNSGYVQFIVGGRETSVFKDSYIQKVMHWKGCSRNKAIHLLENGYRLPKPKP
jgi:hypothetical protein